MRVVQIGTDLTRGIDKDRLSTFHAAKGLIDRYGSIMTAQAGQGNPAGGMSSSFEGGAIIGGEISSRDGMPP